jgi:hypothetical protein
MANFNTEISQRVFSTQPTLPDLPDEPLIDTTSRTHRIWNQMISIVIPGTLALGMGSVSFASFHYLCHIPLAANVMVTTLFISFPIAVSIALRSVQFI